MDYDYAIKISSKYLNDLCVINEILQEPLGGAHREPKAVCTLVGKALTNQLFDLTDLSAEQLLARREQKYRKIGAVGGLSPTQPHESPLI
jgi:acetyl-CoA carboxylase carboxyl transferase subunit alpha